MTVFYAVVLLGVLIFVHELGHFLVAKLLKVKVLKFSLGFGPKVVGTTYGETEYVISAVPLGGYVKMLGQEDMPTEAQEIPEAEKGRAFNFQPVWKRVTIVAAGPFCNIMFAAIVFFFIFMSGIPAPRPEVGKIAENSPAATAGLRTGDTVTDVDGRPVVSFDDIETYVSESHGGTLLFHIRRGEKTLEARVTPEKKTGRTIFGESRETWEAGISPLMFPVVGEVSKGSPAEKAGLRKGDRILAVGEEAMDTWQDMTVIIHANPERSILFKVQRGSEVFEVAITPELKSFQTPDGAEKKIGLIGIAPKGNDLIRKFGVLRSASLGIGKAWDFSVLTLLGIIKLIQGIVPAKSIGSPILIAQMAGQQASQGAVSFFTFMAVISINLGVLNILPIPILDGGHLLFMGIEVIRKKPLSEKAMMTAQRVGLAILITLMVFALYNDILRLATGRMIP